MRPGGKSNGESPFFETPNLSFEGRVGILASLRHRERVTVRRADETRHRHDERQSGATVTSDARGAKGSGESEQRQTQGTGDVQSLSSAETTAGAHVGHDARRPRPLLAPFVPLTPCGADS